MRIRSLVFAILTLRFIMLHTCTKLKKQSLKVNRLFRMLTLRKEWALKSSGKRPRKSCQSCKCLPEPSAICIAVFPEPQPNPFL